MIPALSLRHGGDRFGYVKNPREPPERSLSEALRRFTGEIKINEAYCFSFSLTF